MATNQIVQARIDGAVKEVAQEKALPFEPLMPNAVTIAAMEEARNGRLPQFDSVEALMDDLHEGN